jgi:hypothetical protein
LETQNASHGRTSANTISQPRSLPTSPANAWINSNPQNQLRTARLKLKSFQKAPFVPAARGGSALSTMLIVVGEQPEAGAPRSEEAAACYCLTRPALDRFHFTGVTASGVPLLELIQPVAVSLHRYGSRYGEPCPSVTSRLTSSSNGVVSIGFQPKVFGSTRIAVVPSNPHGGHYPSGERRDNLPDHASEEFVTIRESVRPNVL